MMKNLIDEPYTVIYLEITELDYPEIMNDTVFNYNSTNNASEMDNYSTRGYFGNITWFEVMLFIVCLIGIIGNSLNLLVLTKRRFRTALNNLESSANYGLVALAVCDLFFCVLVLPHAFLPGLNGYWHDSRTGRLLLVYKLYGVGAINLFQMCSTWVIIIIAVNRWVVVMYPLRAKGWIHRRFTLACLGAVFIFSILLTLPHFLNMAIYKSDNNNSNDYHYKPLWSENTMKNLYFYIRWIWPIFANFVPLVLLTTCNVQLVIKIKRTMQQTPSFEVGRRVSSCKVVESKVTVTLLAIVVMYVTLVTPGEVIRYLNPYGLLSHNGVVIANCFNLALTVNFAFNFLLYCAVNATFRQTVKEMIRPRKQSQILKRRDIYQRVATNRTTRTSYKTEVMSAL